MKYKENPHTQATEPMHLLSNCFNPEVMRPSIDIAKPYFTPSVESRSSTFDVNIFWGYSKIVSGFIIKTILEIKNKFWSAGFPIFHDFGIVFWNCSDSAAFFIFHFVRIQTNMNYMNISHLSFTACGLSIFDCPFSILYRLFINSYHMDD
jgi:hypothetical protein